MHKSRLVKLDTPPLQAITHVGDYVSYLERLLDTYIQLGRSFENAQTPEDIALFVHTLSLTNDAGMLALRGLRHYEQV